MGWGPGLDELMLAAGGQRLSRLKSSSVPGEGRLCFTLTEPAQFSLQPWGKLAGRLRSRL